MKYQSDFDLDLKEAHIKEDFVKNLLCKNGLKVEVKYDKKAHITGNLAVEIEYKGRPSGIVTTTADYWAFVLDKLDTTIIIKTDKLKRLAKQNTDISLGGDHDNSVCILIPIDRFFISKEKQNEETLDKLEKTIIGG